MAMEIADFALDTRVKHTHHDVVYALDIPLSFFKVAWKPSGYLLKFDSLGPHDTT